MIPEPMRLVFFAPFCLLRPTTNRIFDVRLCDALAGVTQPVELVHPYYSLKENIHPGDMEKVYGTKHPVQFRMLRTALREDYGTFRQASILVGSFTWYYLKMVFRGNLRKMTILSRDVKLLLPVLLFRKLTMGAVSPKVVIHVHEVRGGRLSRWVYRNVDGIWTTTQAARDKMVNSLRLPAGKFQSICACSAPAASPRKEEARRSIGYASAEPLVVYTGKLGKGIAELEYILDAAVLLPGVNFLLTGGKAETLAYMKELCAQRNLHNVQFSGFINDVSFVRVYQAAADVLVSYYSAKDHAVEYNLPQKMMEYMFSGNPVVTPDFPASRPFVNEQTACLVAPDNPPALAEGIRRLLADPDLAQQLGQKAKEAVQEMTFDKIAHPLLQSLEKSS